jgi:hypothetical protein
VVVFLSYYPSLSGNERLLMSFFDQWALVPVEALGGKDGHTLVTSYVPSRRLDAPDRQHAVPLHLRRQHGGPAGPSGFLALSTSPPVFAAAAGQILADPAPPSRWWVPRAPLPGVMGGYLLMFPRARIDVLVIIIILIKIFTIPAWLMLGIWFGLQLVNGLAMDVAGGGVAYWAHAGGFVAGVLLVLPVFLRRGGTAYWAQTHGKPPHEEVEYVVSRGRRSPVPSVRRVPHAAKRQPPAVGVEPRAAHRAAPHATHARGRGGATDPVALASRLLSRIEPMASRREACGRMWQNLDKTLIERRQRLDMRRCVDAGTPNFVRIFAELCVLRIPQLAKNASQFCT